MDFWEFVFKLLLMTYGGFLDFTKKKLLNKDAPISKLKAERANRADIDAIIRAIRVDKELMKGALRGFLEEFCIDPTCTKYRDSRVEIGLLLSFGREMAPLFASARRYKLLVHAMNINFELANLRKHRPDTVTKSKIYNDANEFKNELLNCITRKL